MIQNCVSINLSSMFPYIQLSKILMDQLESKEISTEKQGNTHIVSIFMSKSSCVIVKQPKREEESKLCLHLILQNLKQGVTLYICNFFILSFCLQGHRSSRCRNGLKNPTLFAFFEQQGNEFSGFLVVYQNILQVKHKQKQKVSQTHWKDFKQNGEDAFEVTMGKYKRVEV